MTFDAKKYWEKRYSDGGNSGKGSRGEELNEKVQLCMDVIGKRESVSILDAGAGDGYFAQLLLSEISSQKTTYRYHAVDFSQVALDKLCEQFVGKISVYEYANICDKIFAPANIAICADVLFHIPSQDLFNTAVNNIVNSAIDYAIFFAWNKNIPLKYPKLAQHVFYYPFDFDGIEKTIELKSNPVKTMYVLKGKAK